MSASSQSPSLRDMYAPSQASWSFVPSRSNNTVAPNVPQTSYEWSTRAPTNPIFDLSSSLSLTEPSGMEIKLLLKGLIAGAVLQYTSTALAMPFEVGKLLLQVQWVPRDLSLLEGPTVVEEEYEEEAEVTGSPLVFRHQVELNERSASRSSAMQNRTTQTRTLLIRQTQTLFVIHAPDRSTKGATLLGGLLWRRVPDQNTSSPSQAPTVFGGWSSASGGLTQKDGWRFSKVIRRCGPVSYLVMTSFSARATHFLCE